MRPKIVTHLKDAWGNELVLYPQGDMYGVGTISSHLRLIPLPQARYDTYGAAYDRLEAEWRQRQAQGRTAMITLAEQIDEARRELALRRKCYPQWVKRGTLTHEDAYHQLSCMEAIVRTLLRLDAEQRQLSLFSIQG